MHTSQLAGSRAGNRRCRRRFADKRRAPCGLDRQRWAISAMNASHAPDASCVQRVGFVVAQAPPVPLGFPAAPGLDMNSGRFQYADLCLAGDVDLRRILERRQHAAQPGWLVVKEQLDGLRRLALVARSTSQHKVRDSIAPTQHLGANVLDFQRHAFGVAVSAPPPLFLQQVFSRFGSHQHVVLVFHAFDVGVIHHLHVKTSS